jgi:hypothetical protein
VSPETKEKLPRFFELAEYVIFRVFVILTLLSAVAVLLAFDYSRLIELRRMLGF